MITVAEYYVFDAVIIEVFMTLFYGRLTVFVGGRGVIRLLVPCQPEPTQHRYFNAIVRRHPAAKRRPDTYDTVAGRRSAADADYCYVAYPCQAHQRLRISRALRCFQNP